MNDHIHVVVEPAPGRRLETIVQEWKSYTTHRLSKGTSRTSPVWLDEYFDRVIRSEAELTGKLNYICGNPSTRWPELQSYPWLWLAD
jgi:REP element-mobilizing transposase RayT